MGACICRSATKASYFKLSRIEQARIAPDEQPDILQLQMEENEERLAKSVWTAMRERFNGRVGTEIFRQLFIRCPELKVIFGVTSISDEVALSDTKLHRHTTIFQDVIDVVITNIGNASILTDSLIDLGAQHWELTKRGFRPTYWLLFGDVMLDLVTSVTRKLPSRRTAVKVWRRVIVFMLDCMQLGYLRSMRSSAMIVGEELLQ